MANILGQVDWMTWVSHTEQCFLLDLTFENQLTRAAYTSELQVWDCIESIRRKRNAGWQHFNPIEPLCSNINWKQAFRLVKSTTAEKWLFLFSSGLSIKITFSSVSLLPFHEQAWTQTKGTVWQIDEVHCCYNNHPQISSLNWTTTSANYFCWRGDGMAQR